jgi:hypothetical protein
MNPSAGSFLPDPVRPLADRAMSATYSLATRTFITGPPVVLACHDGQPHAT